jgi:hypothetical protein
MKMDFDEFAGIAGGEPELPASGGQDSDDDPGESSDETPAERPRQPRKPTIDFQMGPDGPSMGYSGPVDTDDSVELIKEMAKFQQELSGPDPTTKLMEEAGKVARDPEARQMVQKVLFGPDNVESPSPAHAESETMPDPTAELNPGEQPQAETDGGELQEDNIYEITPEGLVAVLQQQVAEVSALKPDMTLTELEQFMEGNQERLIGEAEELLEALDSNG